MNYLHTLTHTKWRIRMGHYGEHTLPDLPYAYDALEPHIDEQTMRLHHDKHHLGYVNGLNKAEQDLAEARKSGDFSKIADIQRRLAFHGSGHVNHTLFWRNMCPPGDFKAPSGELAQQIEKDRSEEHTSELQSRPHLVCRLLLEKKKANTADEL